MTQSVTQSATQSGGPGQSGTEPAARPGADGAMQAAKPPVGVGASPLVAQLVALALIALGVVGIQALLSTTGAIAQAPWITSALDAVDGTASDAPVVLVVAVVAIVLGLLVLPIAFKRRPRKSLELAAHTGVRLRTRDLARIASTAVEGADGVTDVKVTATRRKLRVVATSVAAKDRNGAVVDDIGRRLAPTLEALESRPKLAVSVRNEGVS
ncbi:hypothetical protein SAMN04488570_2023 [Nocardioides scoriae]|uniref:DUF6286 domain-containing protein n=1 Tax=Nocardioides scoriae TaxID=642780 RepID=A0A1H1SQX0_9ACTN|nr:DUF6286 domain-containing protein [Nocardioides scoriae]SDS50325.1 hypothetical protein SAMN04488570_2023 [Nocardioides scoriae]